ncbi:tyrosine--tRNA ligase [Candidatus Parcubacteria bacterium]|nr:tyrosine--tRNA ligase [Candidatus Parcubacteria bacterium]
METDIESLITRGVGTFIDPEGSFKEKLLKKAQGEYPQDIVIKLGVDPSRPDIHLGHAVILRKLRQFQDVGCKVIFLVGDFTARIGDPEGKGKTRPEIEQAEVDKNAQTYIDQVGKILRTEDPKLFSWIRNSDWFTNITDLNLPDDYQISLDVTVDEKTAKVKFPPNSTVGKAIVFEESRMQKKLGTPGIYSITLNGLLWTLRHFTFSRLSDRDMFQDRLKGGGELYMHEMLYPVLQGIDSVAIARIYGSCDLEIGGTDQTFNMLAGRDAMKANKIAPQSVMSLEILPGLDGTEKMSKSSDNYIAITDLSGDMYGKVMSIPDAVIPQYFRLATYTPDNEIKNIEKKLGENKENPRDIKMRLAREIVAIYHGEEAAKHAEEDFVSTFRDKSVPKDTQRVKVSSGTKLVDVVLSQGLVESKSEFARLIREGAIRNAESEEVISAPDFTIEISQTLKIGKRRFISIEIL